jgi:hypothetical protein
MFCRGTSKERYSPEMPDAPLIAQLRIPSMAVVRDVWPSEPSDFTPWLSQHLELVAEVTGLGPLELVETEKSIPGTGRALDILARLPTGESIAIENQYGTVDHDHFTRGLAYAVGLNAVALVLIAEGHLDEFRAVAGYLNSLAERSEADHRIGVYLVGLSVEMVEQYVVPRLALLESPNSWVEGIAQVAAGFRSIEEFESAVPDNARGVMGEVIRWWTEQPTGTVRLGAQTAISLDRPRPGHPNRPLSHVVLNRNGTYTIQRGYLLEGGAVPSDKQGDFDSFLRETFPGVAWQGKNYHLNSQGPPEIEPIKKLVQWLDAASSAPAGAVQDSGFQHAG